MTFGFINFQPDQKEEKELRNSQSDGADSDIETDLKKKFQSDTKFRSENHVMFIMDAYQLLLLKIKN